MTSQVDAERGGSPRGEAFIGSETDAPDVKDVAQPRDCHCQVGFGPHLAFHVSDALS